MSGARIPGPRRRVALVVSAVVVLVASACTTTADPSQIVPAIESADSWWIAGDQMALQFEIVNDGGETEITAVDGVGGLELVEVQWNEESRVAGPTNEPKDAVGFPVTVPANSTGHLYLHWSVLNCAGLGTQEILDGDGGVLYSIDQKDLGITVVDAAPDPDADGEQTIFFDPSRHPNQQVVELYELGTCS